MINTIVGIKKDMGQTFLKNGTRIPVTRIQAGPCVVVQAKTAEKDGYSAVQLGFGTKRTSKLTRPLAGHIGKRLGKEAGETELLPRRLKEIRLAADEEREEKVGSVITANQIFSPGDLVNITGKSKGKGTTGVVRRWGFKGGPRTHGQSDRPRAPGSIGQTTTPGRVYKGKKMAGRSGNAAVTIRNLLLVKVKDDGELWVKGQVPGKRNGLLLIKKIGAVKGFAQGKAEESKRQKQNEEEEKEG